MAFDTWESYFYPPPDEGTLRNLFDERDPVVLTRLEYVETARRQRELLAGQVAIPKTYDAAHMRAIHRHLFQDLYEWAGRTRTVDIRKPGGQPFLPASRIEVGTRFVFDELRADNHLRSMNRPKCIERLAHHYDALNTGGSALSE